MLVDVEERLSSVNAIIEQQEEYNKAVNSELFDSGDPKGSTKPDSLKSFAMERPKSAKFNIERMERYQKSAYPIAKRVINKQVTNKSQENIELNPQNVGKIADEINQDSVARRKEQRLLASKSAFVGTIHLRPQSARHNLEKYRKDAYSEKQKKLEILQKLQKINTNTPDHTNQENMSSDDKNLNVQNGNNSLLNDDFNEDLDNLDGLLIREEDSCSDLESGHSNDETTIKLKPVKVKKSTVKKNKLLTRRNNNIIVPNNNVTITRLNKPESNTVTSANHFTKFRSTAVTSSYIPNSFIPYPTNIDPNISYNVAHSLLVKEQQNQRQQSSVNVIGLHPAHITIRNDENHKNIGITTNTTNSSSSSSSFTFKNQPIHLNEASKKTETLTKELLEEWNRNDDEVDLRIEKIDEYESKSFVDSIGSRRPTIYSGKKQSQLQHPQQQKLILALNAGRTSRFSDYSHGSNMNPILKGQILTGNGYMTREKSNNSMDPWTKRNPTLVAQNVLLKHKAEIEQLNRNANNNSQTSHVSNILTTTTNSKNLLPDTKYFKKNNNF